MAHGGIISGFFTAMVHACVALGALYFFRGGEGPYTSVILLGGVLALVCCLGLLARSHFCSLLLLLLDVSVLIWAVSWCVSLVVAFRTLVQSESGDMEVVLDRTRHTLLLLGAAFVTLFWLWLTRRTYRLEHRLRQPRRV